MSSLFFYGWWQPVYLWLILFSITVNYGCGYFLSTWRRKGYHNHARTLLMLGIIIDIGLLAYFKYANFMIDNINNGFGLHIDTAAVVLPLAISFFTFQQIAYLVDVYRGTADEHNCLQYSLFVTFFPQLIAGPIVHHREMMPQFGNPETYLFRPRYLVIGIIMFAIGFTKKVVFADGLAGYADTVFDGVANGASATFPDAWGGALAFTLQLYFDFSGYTDMAIGLAMLFGIRLPVNFFSPYKAVNIVEFWRRWHMTLSRFLKDYLYIPLGGNRRGPWRRYLNVMITMALGGLWHGAGWTFVIWGSLHGVYIVINRLWPGLRETLLPYHWQSRWWTRSLSYLLTFTAVVVGWVLFRAPDMSTATSLIGHMFGFQGNILPAQWLPMVFISPGDSDIAAHAGASILPVNAFYAIGLLLVVVWGLPNSEQVFSFLHKRIKELEKRQRPVMVPPVPAGGRRSMFVELVCFLRQHHHLWLAPIFLLFMVLGALVALQQVQAVAPFIYFQF